jgi:hypothetical protein
VDRLVDHHTVPNLTAADYAAQIGALESALTAYRLADLHMSGRTDSSNGVGTEGALTACGGEVVVAVG